MTPEANSNLRASARLFARYILAGALLAWGMRGVLRVDGHPPGPFELMRPLGSFTPSQFLELWLYAPPAFPVLAGALKIAVGLLLVASPTLALGAGLTFALLLNAVMLDLCFHTGRAAATGILLSVSAFVLLPYARVFFTAFVLNRPTEPPSEPAFSAANLGRKLAGPLALLLAAWVVYQGAALERLRADQASRSPLAGAYRVENFSLNGEELPSEAEIDRRWSVLAFDSYASALAIRTTGGNLLTLESFPPLPHSGFHAGDYARFAQLTATPEGTLHFSPSGPVKTPQGYLHYRLLPDGRIVLQGDLNGDVIVARLRRVAEDSFPFFNPRVWAYPF